MPRSFNKKPMPKSDKPKRSQSSSKPRERREREPRDNPQAASSPAYENLVFGKNAVQECLDADVSVNKLWVLANSNNPKQIELEKAARQQKIPVMQVDRKELDRISGGAVHKSIIAQISPIKFLDEDFLIDNEKVNKILIAVNIEDPHNLGAISRSVRAFGIDALVITSRNSSPINETVISSSAGAILKTNIVRAGNITNLIKKLKDSGFWVYGSHLDKDKSTEINKIDFDDKSVLLVGNEGKGLSDKLVKHCDFIVHIPVKFESLNVSVATGILLSHLSK